MLNRRLTVFAFLATAGFCAMPAAASPVCSLAVADICATLNYSGTGSFTQDDNQQSFIFTLDSSETVNLFTTSFASGGFAPVLTLFDDGADNNFIASDSGGQAPDNCTPRVIANFDQSGGTCLDAYITAVLASGKYRLVLTESGNSDSSSFDVNLGTVYSPYVPCDSDGTPSFLCGSGNFTGEGGFHSPNNGNQLSSAWAVTIAAVSADAPEPVTSLIGLSGLLLTLAVARRKTSN